jgi:hypothetical protein
MTERPEKKNREQQQQHSSFIAQRFKKKREI